MSVQGRASQRLSKRREDGYALRRIHHLVIVAASR